MTKTYDIDYEEIKKLRFRKLYKISSPFFFLTNWLWSFKIEGSITIVRFGITLVQLGIMIIAFIIDSSLVITYFAIKYLLQLLLSIMKFLKELFIIIFKAFVERVLAKLMLAVLFIAIIIFTYISITDQEKWELVKNTVNQAWELLATWL